ncbi:helix-turn-helix domain-containing protein [Marinobacteraceae bacterium S3BR75-40.1]
MATDLRKLGQTIAQRRKQAGIKTQETLSGRTGVTRTRISAMEQGKFHGRLTDLLKVLDALGLELDLKVSERPVFEDLNELFPDDED